MKVEGLKIEGKMLSHMAFDTAHIMKHELTIIAPGNLINGRLWGLIAKREADKKVKEKLKT